MLADVRADRHEDRIETPRVLFGRQILDLVIEDDPDAHRLDARDLLHQILARQAVGGDAEMHHAAGQRAGLVDLDGVARAAPGGRRRTARSDRRRPRARACRSAARRLGRRQPSSPRQVAEEALDRVDADRAVELCRDCSGSRTGGSRPGHAPRAAGCRAPASARLRDSDPPAHARATPGCSLRPGRRCCTAARDRRRSDAARGPVPCPASRRGR